MLYLYYMMGIYKITSPSGKIYIGSSTDLNKRQYHYKNLRCKQQRKLYNSLLKYGFENHTFEILEECSIEMLFMLERVWGDFYNVLDYDKGLNLQLPGYGDVPSVMSQETKDIMSQQRKGRKLSKEWIENGIRSRKGLKRSPEFGNKMRLIITGKKRTPEQNAHNGKVHWKQVIDTSTGIIYPSVKHILHLTKYTWRTLQNMLSGNAKNNTTFLYVK